MIALAIIYNHRYDKNIPLLEKIYKGRFSNIFHIVPFYDGSKDNVITVYEHSFYFQGYIAQVRKELRSKGNFEHFVFVGDDVLLHPYINETNYRDFFKIGLDDSFITFIRTLEETGKNSDLFIMHLAQYFKFPDKPGTGLEIMNEIPSYDQAVAKFKEKGYEEPYLLSRHLYPYPKRTDFKNTIFGEIFYRRRIREVKKLLGQEKIKVNYPMLNGFSDVLAIAEPDFDQFARYCGLFATARMFVEYAIPTIMTLVCKKVVTQDDLTRKSVLMWDNDRIELEKKYDLSFNKITEQFQDDILFIHPVKLSRWKLDL